MIMKLNNIIKAAGLALGLVACAVAPEYPEMLGSDIDPNFDFGAVRAALDQYTGIVFQVAGEVLGIESGSDGIRVLARRRWIRSRPEYPGYEPMPVERRGLPGDQFFLSYQGDMDAQALRLGNKFIAVAELAGEKDDRLVFRCRCWHVWKTGHHRRADLADRYSQLYQAMEEDTYCAPARQDSPQG